MTKRYKPRLSPERERRIRTLVEGGASYADASHLLNLSIGTVAEIIRLTPGEARIEQRCRLCVEVWTIDPSRSNGKRCDICHHCAYDRWRSLI